MLKPATGAGLPPPPILERCLCFFGAVLEAVSKLSASKLHMGINKYLAEYIQLNIFSNQTIVKYF
jgi:hypothetical protein